MTPEFSSSPVREPKQVKDRALELTRTLLKTPLLGELERGEAAPERWQQFIEQRYLAGRDFEALLAAGEQAATQSNLPELATAFRDNLAEERGESTSHPGDAHELWRHDMYVALRRERGLLTHELAAPASVGTRTYQQAIELLVQSADPYELAGALMGLELSIPGEFRRILKGLELAFPNSFGEPADTDTLEQRSQRERARRYLDDHIHHDTRHYQEILDAIGRSLAHELDPSTAEERVVRGVDIILNAKRAFYEHCLQPVD